MSDTYSIKQKDQPINDKVTPVTFCYGRVLAIDADAYQRARKWLDDDKVTSQHISLRDYAQNDSIRAYYKEIVQNYQFCLNISNLHIFSDTPCGRFLAKAERELSRPLSLGEMTDCLLDNFIMIADSNDAREIAKSCILSSDEFLPPRQQ